MKTLYWIDDTHDDGKPPKPAATKRLEEGLHVKLKVAEINNRKGFDDLFPRFLENQTCGVIMDYELSKVGENNRVAYGNTWAAEIRAVNPLLPVIGISHESQKKIPKLRLEGFLAFFPRDELMGMHPPLKDISALLSGYRRICDMLNCKDGKSGVERMVELIGPPAKTADLVKAAIPSALRGVWDKETPHTAGRWLWHELQGLPGFLFDELGLATHLGLNLKGLERVYSKFNAARYRGAFASEGRPRWWVGSIREIFEQLIGGGIVGPISNAREKLLQAAKIKVPERSALLSRPYGRKGSDAIPDCVASEPSEIEKEHLRVQAMFDDTIVDDRDANPAFGFEPRRIFASHKRK